MRAIDKIRNKLFIDNKCISLELIKLADDNEFVGEINSLCAYYVRHELSKSISIDEDFSVFITLAVIAINHYDNSFWPYVRSQLPLLYTGQLGSGQTIDSAIRRILKRVNERFFGSNNLRPIFVPLMEPIVTKHTYNNFLTLMLDVYKYNFDHYFDVEEKDNDVVLSFVFSALKKNIKIGHESDDEETEINIGTSKRSYILSRYTQGAIYFQERYLESLIELAKISLHFIDDWYWERRVYRSETWLDQEFDRWAQNRNRERQLSKSSREKRELLQRPIWCFSTEFNHVFLKPKIQILPTDIDPLRIEIIVEQDSDSFNIPYDDISIKGVIGGYEISAKQIMITNPLSTVKYKVIDGSNLIYDTNQLLHRTHLFFNQEGREVLPFKDYQGALFVICKRIDPTFMQLVMEHKSYSVGLFLVSPGKEYNIDGTFYQFSTRYRPSINGEKVFGARAIFHDELIDIYRTIETFSFVVGDATNHRIVLDGDEIDIKSSVDIVSMISTGDGVIKIKLPSITTDIHRITYTAMVNGSQATLFEKTFVYDPDLEISFDNNNLDSTIDIISNLSDEIIELHLSTGNIDTSINLITPSGTNISYVIYSPFVQYCIKDTFQHFGEAIFQSEIDTTTTLKVFSLQEITTIKVKRSDGFILYELQPQRRQNDIYSFDVGFFTSIKGKSFDYLLNIENESYVICSIPFYTTNQLITNATKIYLNEDNDLVIQIDYKGNNQMFLRLTGDDDPLEHEMVRNETLKIKNMLPFKKYHLEIFEKADFLDDYEKVHFSDDYQFINHRALIGHKFKITKVMYTPFNNRRNVFFSEKILPIRNQRPIVVQFIDKQSDDIYLCRLFDLYESGILIIRNFPDILLSIEDFQSGKGILAQCTDVTGDQLLYDVNNYQLLDIDSHPTAQPIEAIFLDLKEGPFA